MRSSWVRITGIALLLYIPWSFYDSLDSSGAAILGLIFTLPFFYAPILIIGYRLLRISPVDQYRRVAAVCGIAFMIANTLNFHQTDRQAQMITFPIVLAAGFSALLASTLPKKTAPTTSSLPQSKELRR